MREPTKVRTSLLVGSTSTLNESSFGLGEPGSIVPTLWPSRRYSELGSKHRAVPQGSCLGLEAMLMVTWREKGYSEAKKLKS
ncbi:hypothetical protein AOLI_G00215370 [Acnodon oligacanthus]